MSPATWAGLPSPEDGSLTLFAIGPGFGESQVVFFPDGRCMVVDACRVDGECAPLALLQHFGRTRVDLLVVTHGDLDHVDGLPDLIAGTEIGEAWRYPEGSWIMDHVAHWRQLRPRNRRLRRLHAALQALEELDVPGGSPVHPVSPGHEPWPPDRATVGYEVTPVAPTRYDRRRELLRTRAIIENVEGAPRLSHLLYEYLVGRRSSLGAKANVLSVALSVTWGEARLLLSGDVERGDGTPQSGWRGVVAQMEERNQEELLTDLAIVKLAHHGSAGAVAGEAWDLHASTRPVPLALVSPFNRGNDPPPHTRTFRRLRRRVKACGLTADNATAREHIEAAGWTVHPEPQVSPAPCIQVRVYPENRYMDACVGVGRIYRPPAAEDEDTGGEPASPA